MLGSNKIVGFAPTRDYDKARSFYEGALGLPCLHQDDFAITFKAGATTIRVSKVPDYTPAPFTILGWEVEDIKKEVQELTERGVAFEKYSFLKQDDLGIWDAPGGAKVAWFKDPDGNILSVAQMPAYQA